MGQSFEDLLDQLIAIRDQPNASPDIRIDHLESLLQALLEKLRDRFEPR